MIVFAAIVPHSPLLVPTIGKEHREKLECTLRAYEEVGQALYGARPDTLIIFSPHGSRYADAFSGNVAPTFNGVLKEFGDHGTNVRASLDTYLLDHINRGLRKAGVPFTLTSQEELDYGYTVPLLFLTQRVEQRYGLVPLSPSLLSPEQHKRFGQELQQILQNETRRVALIASADLSHQVAKGKKSSVTQEGKAFDRLVRSCLNDGRYDALAEIDPALIEAARACGHKPITMLTGALSGMNLRPRELCYEAPFGVGYLTTIFDFA
jgi:MEMO1 family protein